MRSAEFDRQVVLRQAMAKFVEKGYGKTSMQDLKLATGLHPGSIYCAFDNKRGLLIAALEQYQLDRHQAMEALFASYPTVFEGIEAYMESVLEECEQEQIKDCLLQKALSELAHQDEQVEALISDMLRRWQQWLVDKIAVMMELGEIANHRSPELVAQFLVMGIYGMRTLSHTQPDSGVLRALNDELLRYIKG